MLLKATAPSLFVIFCFVSCLKDQPSGPDPMPSLFRAPMVVSLDTIEGYAVNPFTGDSIFPMFDTDGSRIVSGKAMPVGPCDSTRIKKYPGRSIPVKPPDAAPTNTNIHDVRAPATTIPLIPDSLEHFELGALSEDGDTLQANFTIPAQGTEINLSYPKPIPAKPLRFKDDATYQIQYLNVDQGLPGPFIVGIAEDKNGFIWIATRNVGIVRFDGYRFTHFTEKEGLPKDACKSILNDKEGNIWIGHGGVGVTKYDGQKFTYFGPDEGFPCHTVQAILEDRKGNFWFGSSCGLTRMDTASLTTFGWESGLPAARVQDIIEDKSGNIWFTFNNAPDEKAFGVYRFDGQTFTHFSEKSGFTNKEVLSILEDRNGAIWFGLSNGGALRFDGSKFTHFTEKEGLTDFSVYYMHEDQRGRLWFGTLRGGIIQFDGARFTHFTEKEGLSNNWVLTIAEDRAGNIWIGTSGGGVNKIAPNGFQHYTIDEGLSDNYVLSMWEDTKGNLLFGTRNNGLNIYDGHRFLQLTTDHGLPHYMIGGIIEDKDQHYWLLTGLTQPFDLYQYTGSALVNQPWIKNFIYTPFSMAKDREGNLWFGAQNGGHAKYNGSNICYYPEIAPIIAGTALDITEDKQGNIWFNSRHRGFGKFDGDSFTLFTEKEGIPSNSIGALLADQEGNIWIGTPNAGVARFDGQHITCFDEGSGLINNKVHSLLEDKNGNIWVGTHKGLSCLKGAVHRDSLKGIPIINFTEENGLKGLSFMNSNLLDRNNQAWWATEKCLTTLDLNAFSLPDQKPMVHLEHIEIHEQFFDFRNLPDSVRPPLRFLNVAEHFNYPLGLELPHHQNHLTFYFAATDWPAPYDLLCSYKIEGLDENWSLPKNEFNADYRNLPPGTHTIKFRAIGAAMKWSDPVEYTFTILPPWWQTWWARALLFLLLLSAVVGYTRWRTNALKKQKVVLEKTVEERTIQLKAQKERAERSEKFKEQFLANMSHEIRTPMHAISGMTNILLRNRSFQHQKKFLHAIQRSSANLLVILNDILDLSKIEAGKIEIEHLPLRLSEVVENTVEIMRVKAEEKGLALRTSLSPDIPELVFGDPTRLNQILLNLIGNAIKFTEEGAIEIAVSQANDKVRFAVKDTGIGIPADKLDRIFGTFEQVDESTTRKHGGTGLGLSICKQLVELQNGSIWVESQEQAGSTFFFELPLLPVEGEALESVKISEDHLAEMAAALSGIKILLAEDNEFNVMIATDDLTYYIQDVSIELAENGKEALEAFKTGQYDLILMDIQMPEMNGLEAARAIREWESSQGKEKQTPIIAMTASLLRSEIEQCYQAGMTSYVPKPYQIEELIKTLFTEFKGRP